MYKDVLKEYFEGYLAMPLDFMQLNYLLEYQYFMKSRFYHNFGLKKVLFRGHFHL